jgi:hypothetical protein
MQCLQSSHSAEAITRPLGGPNSLLQCQQIRSRISCRTRGLGEWRPVPSERNGTGTLVTVGARQPKELNASSAWRIPQVEIPNGFHAEAQTARELERWPC